MDLHSISKLASDKHAYNCTSISGQGINSVTPTKLNKRSSSTDLQIQVLGAGGVGSNVFSRINTFAFIDNKLIDNLTFTDFDDIELHNLNRTFSFSLRDVGSQKVEALKSKIIPSEIASHSSNSVQVNNQSNRIFSKNRVEIRSNFSDTIILRDSTIPYASEDATLRRIMNINSSKTSLVIDCRDTLDVATINKYTWIKLAYNGGNDLAVHFNPLNYMQNMWSTGGGGYEVVPSFYVPASILSTLPLYFLNFKCLTNLNPTRVKEDSEINELPSGQVYFKIDETMNSSSFDLKDLLE